MSRHRISVIAGLVAGLVALGGLERAASAMAPRDDIKTAYDQALGQFNNLDLDAAVQTVERAIGAAEAAAGSDPYLASLYVMRAALVYSNQGDDGSAAITAALQKAVALNYYVVVPLEMRSEGLTKYLEQARKSVAAPTDTITAKIEPACGADLVVEALLGVPDGGQAAFYWRKAGSTEEAKGEEMVVFSNVATVTIPASAHADADLEYFIYAFDQNSQPAANLGDAESPAKLDQNCEAVVAGGGTEEPKEPEEPKDEKPKREFTGSLPKLGWFNIGLGTGFGVVPKGSPVENTYQQFFPNSEQLYGEAEEACAMARWAAGEGELADTDPNVILGAWDNYGYSDRNDLNSALTAKGGLDWCSERHKADGGMASAPFHIQPELNFLIGKKRRMAIGVFGRLQVVTASNVIRDDPNKGLDESFQTDVRNPNPEGVKVRAKFPWAVGAKFKYFFGKDTSKFRPYVGAYAGYGRTALRIDMGFANDENGNSVPDNLEVGADAINDQGDNCHPVWPYNNACVDPPAPDPGDNKLAVDVRNNASGKKNRVDVVAIGPGFVGGLVGFNYQIHKHFALFGELNIGGWFPATSSALFDINVGPAITF